jgi:hypothetical protein
MWANAVGYKKPTPDGDKHRVRLSADGSTSDYEGERTSQMVDIDTVKVNLNHLVSDETLDYCTLDLTDMYLMSKLLHPEYMWMMLSLLPHDLRVRFHMDHLPEKSKILWRIDNALYGLPQAGHLAQMDVVKLVETGGYYMDAHVPNLFHHQTRPLTFLLWVDDFFITYKRGDRSDVEHLLSILGQMYTFKIDWEGRMYLGLTIKYDRPNHEITLSIPGYITRMNAELGVIKGNHDPGSPITYTAPVYGKNVQVEELAIGKPIGPKDIKFIQRAVGKCLFLTRMVCPSIELAVNRLGSTQSQATDLELKATHRLLQHLAWNDNPSITFRPSNMQLVIHSDGSHGSESHSRSRAAGVFYFGDPYFEGPDDLSHLSKMQAPTATLCAIVPTICQAVNETEYATAYMNAQKGTAIRITAAAFGHPQQPTAIIYDNELSGGMANNTCKLRRSKAVSMRYHWLRDRVKAGDFKMIWRAGAHNLADFLSKAHPVRHYKAMTPFFDHTAALKLLAMQPPTDPLSSIPPTGQTRRTRNVRRARFATPE